MMKTTVSVYVWQFHNAHYLICILSINHVIMMSRINWTHPVTFCIGSLLRSPEVLLKINDTKKCNDIYILRIMVDILYCNWIVIGCIVCYIVSCTYQTGMPCLLSVTGSLLIIHFSRADLMLLSSDAFVCPSSLTGSLQDNSLLSFSFGWIFIACG